MFALTTAWFERNCDRSKRRVLEEDLRDVQEHYHFR